jgi:hypothetical protein
MNNTAGSTGNVVAIYGSLVVSFASLALAAASFWLSRKTQARLEQDKSRKLEISIKEGNWIRKAKNLLTIRVLMFNPSTRVNTVKGYGITVRLTDQKEHVCAIEELTTGEDSKINPLPLEIGPGCGIEVETGTLDVNFSLLPDPFICKISIIDIYSQSSSVSVEIPHPERSLRLLYPTSTPKL